MTILVREATADDIPAIARIASIAFHPATDAISRALFPPHLQAPASSHDGADIGEAAYPWRLARKSASLRAFNGLDDGSKMLVAVDDAAVNGQVVGFATWDAPEREGNDEELEAMKHWAPDPPPAALDAEAFRELRRIVDGDVKAVIGDEAKKTWNLDYLGVDPQHQRRGIGRKLITAGLEMAADMAAKQGDGAFNCYLVATPAGQALYESVGFKVENELNMFGCVHRSMMLRSQGKNERN